MPDRRREFSYRNLQPARTAASVVVVALMSGCVMMAQVSFETAFAAQFLTVALIGLLALIPALAAAMNRAQVPRFETGMMRLGGDGLLLDDRFHAWDDVISISAESSGVALVLASEPGIRLLDVDDPLEFVDEANRRLRESTRGVSVHVPEYLRLRDESAEARHERLDRIGGGGGYRELVVDPQDLQTVACAASASPAERTAATRVLVRVDPSILDPVRAALEEIADEDLRQAMAEAMDDDGTTK